MSLPTPPHTGHREKENRIPLTGAHVIWSPHNQYRTITHIAAATSALPHVPAAASASKTLPPKSILKKRSEPLLPLVAAFQRDTTPEPERPKFDPTYLSSPVATIIDSSASLDDLIRAYSVLAARLRATITLNTDSDASWPILEPLRNHRAALEEAMIRDIGRCLIDPETMKQTPEDMEEEACLKEQPVFLPSPKSSPKKKKKGTTAKKAKYGRDLCTTCHSVIKLLAVVFTLPAVSGVFTVPQLRSILAQVLAIPLADDLPTPNARKTYALSIWLLQSQRLPPTVLEKAADRIVFALRRGIEGELGKEGKKGSASDGLKAIHDLSVYQPSIFVLKFEVLLPSVLSSLLAPTLALRAQACHALGGFARGLVTLPVSSLHSRISAAISSYLTTAASPSPSKKSPTKPPYNESAIARTLRTTLQATEVQHVSQGPVWGLSVLASLLVLANSAVYADEKTRRAFIALLSRAMGHRKSSIRSLGCAVWRCTAWAYCQPLLPGDGDDESEVDEENDRSKRRIVEQGREAFWTQVVVTVVDMGVGISTTAALLEEAGSTTEETLTRVATILKVMASKGGDNLESAIETLARIVSFEPTATKWSWSKLLPRGLFSASPGLLTADYTSLEPPVRSIIAQCPNQRDVRSLTREDVAQPEIFDKLVEMWRECIGCLGLPDDDAVPAHILMIWDHLIGANVANLQDSETPEDDIAEFANKAADILTDILLDTTIDVTLKAGEVRFCTDGLEPTNELSNAALKLKLVRALWAITRKAISKAQLDAAGQKLICTLVEERDEFTDSGEGSRTEWAAFCAEVLMVCSADDLQEFWKGIDESKAKWEWTDAIRGTVWRAFVEKWKEESESDWHAAVTLLGVPFTAKKPWDLSDSDLALWECCLGPAVDKGFDCGLDLVSVLDHIASIVEGHSPTSTTASRVADILLSQLAIEEARELPETLFEFVNETLRSSYPPEPRNTPQALWTLRTVTRAIENCPADHVVQLLRLVEAGVCAWVSDAHLALSDTDYAYDAVNLYEVTLMRIRSLAPDVAVLESLGAVLESGFIGRENKPAAINEAFAEFWHESYSDYPVPADGWPIEIQTCLGISSDEVDLLDPDDPWNKLSLSPAFRGVQVVSARGQEVPVSSPFKLGSARFRSASPEIAHEAGRAALEEHAQSCRPVTPTTPVAARSRASTPPRPHKLPFASQSSPTSPDSPLYAPYPPSTPSTTKRTPLRIVSASKSSPNKRRKLDNKENISPSLPIASVMERIIAASPRSGHDLAASKKHASPNHGEEERPLKRSKTGMAMPSGEKQSFHPTPSDNDAEEEEEHLVELSLVERDQSRPTLTATFDVVEDPTPLSKKRKRVLFDAVEVPTVRAVYSGLRDTLPLAFAMPSRQDRPQTRSTSNAARRALASAESPSVSRKRRRDRDDPFFSEDSMTRARSSKDSSDLSSDDDVYFGQVTPHHVFSPVLRRARDDDPPSSDDSNMSVSPLKGVVSRRLQKTGSNGRLARKAVSIQ
ncbi:hypothetical protein B0H17DRAFT_1079271 [Mycena rosella]|uniref:Telomere-associated protein Rif1 N-terminal domain-containing protein n=1 Tax=Mycena rosella TaxID=1033263 RepID=A0AAD7GAZ5_MYCRO|nr:hypothetical protein B0H17DRAFT_1079271 [Mycena rosella]